MNDYYVYRHIRIDKDEVFYIGIGQSENRYKSKHSRNKYWQHITNVSEWYAEIMLQGLSREQAELKEKEFISLYGRKNLNEGTLCNLTAGGTGGLGLKHTEETKLKMKNRIPNNKGIKKFDEELIARSILSGMSESMIQKKYQISKGSIWRIKQQIKNESR